MSLSLGEHGCGATHSRPVTHGAPAKEFRLDCPPCEAHLRGDRKQKKLVYETDKRSGQPVRQARVADSDPLWSSTPDTVPPTPDEERVNSIRQERGAQQIQMIQALAALRGTGLDIPAEAMWLLERELPAGVLKGTVVCANGHDNQTGLKFCGECGISMAAKGEIEGSDPDPSFRGHPVRLTTEPEFPLEKLHVATLRKKCRERGLPDKGTKAQLVKRLEAAVDPQVGAFEREMLELKARIGA